MRLYRAGYGGPLPPIALDLSDGVPFVPSDYMELGYTDYEVLCVGGAGARGLNMFDSGHIAWGGGGGGGGSHRRRGVLSGLPSSCPVVVGAPGTFTGGADGKGGLSSFNDPTCRASGGLPGANAISVFSGGIGGHGGIGDSDTAGGGALPGVDGTWDGTIGSGGAGGFGGAGVFSGLVTSTEGTASTRGSYSPDDTSFMGPASGPTDSTYGAYLLHNLVPGVGGGASAVPILGYNLVYGSVYGLNHDGVGGVAIRLTKV